MSLFGSGSLASALSLLLDNSLLSSAPISFEFELSPENPQIYIFIHSAHVLMQTKPGGLEESKSRIQTTQYVPIFCASGPYIHQQSDC